ncbi:MAG TPA: nucleotidyltransferase domain-containing protein [Desulfosporosinus sp.]|nr:nucleotidyltransferase domain-containing protein [Desulfosporosinus sp.]
METIPNPLVGKIVESVTRDSPEEQSVDYNMHATGNKDIEISKKVKQSIGEKILLYEVRLFGSRARGEASTDSDLDLYLETGPISREQRRLISDLVWEIGFENDIVISPLVIPQSEAKNGAFSVSTLCKAIKTEGISI